MSSQPNEVCLQDRLMQLANLEANELAEVMQQAADRIEADEALMRKVDESLRFFRFVDSRHITISDYLKADAAIAALRARLETSNV